MTSPFHPNESELASNSARPIDSVSLEAILQTICRDVWGESLQSWECKKTWSRPYSRGYHVVVQCVSSSHQVLLKQLLMAPANMLHHQRGMGVENEWRGLTAAAQVISKDATYGVPAPYRVFPEWNLISMESVDGISLDECLAATRWFSGANDWRRLLIAWERLGSWLREFQQRTREESSGPDDLMWWHRVTLQRLQEIMSAMGRQLPRNLELHVQRDLDFWRQAITKPIARAGCHGDFGPWNTLVSDERVVIVDFFAYRSDATVIDPLNVVSYLRALQSSPRLNRRRLVACEEAFLTGYGAWDVSSDAPLMEFARRCHDVCRLHDAVHFDTATWQGRWRRQRWLRTLVPRLVGAHPNLR